MSNAPLVTVVGGISCPACMSVISQLASADISCLFILADSEQGQVIMDAARTDTTPVTVVGDKYFVGAAPDTVQEIFATYITARGTND